MINTLQMELSLTKFFNPIRNLIIPNVRHGFLKYEADLIVMTKSGYLSEVEIKISKSDFDNDFKKKHSHGSKKIKYFYYAFPKDLMEKYNLIEEVPNHAGVISVDRRRLRTLKINPFHKNHSGCEIEKKPKLLYNYKLSLEEQYKLARLGAIRVWSLKQRMNRESLC